MSEDFDKTRPPLRITIAPEMDATMPGRRVLEPIAEPADVDATMPGKRDRKDDGRFAVGDLIMNRYKVLSELGQGGMGVVYRCLDETAGVEVALKALPPELSHNTLEMEDIKENFQLVSQLVHQNIAVYKNLERDLANGNYYLIMECCEGEDLRRWIKRKRKEGTLTLETVLPIIQQVAAALDYAHSEKIIHRDIKPGNIMIDQSGKIKVLDFGLAAQIHTSMTRVSMAYHGTSGTGPYMAPEQWRGRAQGAAADQYALAVMTYEMLAGRLPFESSDAAVLREAVLNDTPEEITVLPKNASEALKRAMSKEPAERFESCSEFAAALSGKKVSGGKVQKKSGYIKWTAMLIISLLLLAGGVGYYFFDKYQKEQAVQEQIAAGNAEIERLSKIVAENAEKERQAELAAEKAEKERQAKIAAERARDINKAALDQARAEKDAAGRQLAGAKDALNKEKEKVKNARAALESQQRNIDTMNRMVDDTFRKLSNAQDERKQAERNLEKIRRDLERIQQENIALKADSAKLKAVQKELDFFKNDLAQTNHSDALAVLDLQWEQRLTIGFRKIAQKSFLPVFQLGSRSYVVSTLDVIGGSLNNSSIPENIISLEYKAGKPGSATTRIVSPVRVANDDCRVALMDVTELKGIKPLKLITWNELRERGSLDLYLFKSDSMRNAKLENRCTWGVGNDKYIYVANNPRAANELKAQAGDLLMTRQGELAGVVVLVKNNRARCYVFPVAPAISKMPRIDQGSKQSKYQEFTTGMSVFWQKGDKLSEQQP